MSRRKHLAPRKPCGRLASAKDTHLMAPAQVRRLVDAASEGMRDPIWATPFGLMYLNGKISATEFAAGKRWAEIVASYSTACRSPLPPRTISLDAPGGTPTDPDTESGERELRRHERAAAAFLEGRNALRLAGREAERVVEHVCVREGALAGFYELSALSAGLAALAALWAAKRKASAR